MPSLSLSMRRPAGAEWGGPQARRARVARYRAAGGHLRDWVSGISFHPRGSLVRISGFPAAEPQKPWLSNHMATPWQLLLPVLLLKSSVLFAEVATSSGDSTLKIWDVAKEKCKHTLTDHTQSCS